MEKLGKSSVEVDQNEDELCDCWQPQGKQGSFTERLKNPKVLGKACLEQIYKEIIEMLCNNSENRHICKMHDCNTTTQSIILFLPFIRTANTARDRLLHPL